MAVTDDRTANLNLPLPHKDNQLQDDVGRLRAALVGIDTAWPDKADLVGGKIPADQLPSFVDDVLEFDTLELFPAVGESGKIYTAIDTGRTYRWSGSAYTMLNDFELKPATGSTLGGIRVGSGLVVNAQGVVSTVGGSEGEGLPAFNEMTLVASTAGQTSFLISGGYSPGNIDLYNSVGALLIGNGDDYTASNGTTIVLTQAATLGERFLLRRWTTATNLPFGALVDTPTSVDGYGIEDAVKKTGDTMTGHLLLPAGATGSQAITAAGVDTKIANKADKSTTLAGYGITNAVPSTGGRFTGSTQFPHTQAVGYAGDPGGLKIGGLSESACVMTFHRTSYAINFGLDTDNVIRIGGWSQGSGGYRMSLDAAGNFTAAGNVTAYSDRRLKKDLQKIEGALDKIKQLTGYTYTRKDTGERQTGLVAQDVRDVMPEAVQEMLGVLTVAYGNLAGLFAEGIKELDEKIEALKARVG